MNSSSQFPSDFPTNFLWGASTASHQVEGGTHNQWSEWEKAQAPTLAHTAERRLGKLPSWQNISSQAQAPANYISGAGVEHYSRYRTDFDILTQLNMNAYRFGIEWSRIEPRPGEWDAAAIEHYREYLQQLKQRGITPVITLWHWTMPVWFADRGGFAKRGNLALFERYVQKIAELFGEQLSYVITLNEPNVYTGLGYATGEWPPQERSPLLAIRVYANLAEAHRRAYRILKQANPKLQIGIASQLSDTRATEPRNPINRVGVAAKLYAWNWWFLNRINGHQDFIGVNYYFTEYQDWLGRIKNPTKPVSDLGWYMEPSGLGRLLVQVWNRYRTPLLVSENGLADSSDSQRKWWLGQTMGALEYALEQGVDLRGYLHWSLLDNFEWAYGWWPQFGLVHVDRTTMKRTIRPSARVYADYIKRHKGL